MAAQKPPQTLWLQAKKAILFNPAKANLGAYGLDAGEYDGDIKAYVVDGEALNNIFGDTTPSGDAEILAEKSALKKITEIVSSGTDISELLDSINRHSIKKVIEELKKEEKKK